MNSISASSKALLERKRGTTVLSRYESSGPYFQSDADLSGIIFNEVNTDLFKSFLYFDDG
jgi:hypothetical protein